MKSREAWLAGILTTVLIVNEISLIAMIRLFQVSEGHTPIIRLVSVIIGHQMTINYYCIILLALWSYTDSSYRH